MAAKSSRRRQKETSTENERESVVTSHRGSHDDASDGLRQGLISCFVSIGAMSLIIWIILFFLLRSGDCTKIDSVNNLVKGVESTKGSGDWKLFAQELGLSADQISVFTQEYVTGDSPSLHKVAKFWYELGMEVCWERLISALEVVGEGECAGLLTQQYLKD